MRHLGILTKLALGFGVTLLSIMLLGTFSWLSMERVDKASTAVEEAFMPVVSKTNLLETHMTHGVMLLRDFFSDLRHSKYLEGHTQIRKARQLIGQILDTVDKTPKLTPLRTDTMALDAAADRYLSLVDQLQSTYKDFDDARQELSNTATTLSISATNFLQSHFPDLQEQTPAVIDPKHQRDPLLPDRQLLDVVVEIWRLRVLVERSSVMSQQDHMRLLRTSMDELQRLLGSVSSLPPHRQCLEQYRLLETSLARMFANMDMMQTIFARSLQARDEARQQSATLLTLAQELPAEAILLTRELARQTSQATETASQQLLIAAVLASLVGLAIMLLVGRSIVKPLEACVNYAALVAHGHAVAPLQLEGSDETSRLAKAITCMVDSLQERLLQQRRMQGNLLQARGVADIAMGMTRSASWTLATDAPPCFEISPQLLGLLGLPDDTPMLLLDDRINTVAQLNPQTAKLVRDAFTEVITGESESSDIEYQLPKANTGEVIWVREMVQAIYGPMADGEGRILLGITQDVTAYRRQQEALEAATRAQSSFIANMSHEIRTPMNAIVGMGHLLRRTELTDLQRDYLEKIDSSGQLLLCLINDILDLSKIEAGKLHMECIDFDLHEVMNRTRSTADGLLSAKKLSFAFTIDSAVPTSLQGDPYRLQQVLNNLVSNACKFTPHGSVALSVDLADTAPPSDTAAPPGSPLPLVRRGETPIWPQYLEQSETAVRLRFKVRDTGLGMTQEVLARLFKPFSQADSSITRKFGGTGLGLAICKHLVELMGGRISVISAVDQGSTFEFSVLLGVGSTAAQPEPDESTDGAFAPCANPGHILLVEDNSINSLIATEMLGVMGHSVDVAENGAIAVDKCRATVYDLILMDIQMPILDGLSAAQIIRENSLCRHVAIVAMTAHAMDTDRARSMESGMNAHITKPIDPDILRQTVEKWLRREV